MPPQGLTRGQCDLISEAMLKKDGKSIFKWGEFERIMIIGELDPNTKQALDHLAQIIRDFRVRTHRVIWRVLLTYFVITQLYRHPNNDKLSDIATTFVKRAQELADSSSKIILTKELATDINAATTYLAKRISSIRDIYGIVPSIP